jgi:hypothetical protein
MPLFSVERAGLKEISVEGLDFSASGGLRQFPSRELLFRKCEFVGLGPRQWVIVARCGCLALRNIDHLIPPEQAGNYGPPEIDFYWARVGRDDSHNELATPGFWAVRGEHLALVLGRWKAAWNRESGAGSEIEEKVWTRVVQDLPLRKRAFEKGEVVAPRIGAVDWEAVSNAAFVTVPDWREKEAWKFLQALYFGTYLGDETGMMLNILEA